MYSRSKSKQGRLTQAGKKHVHALPMRIELLESGGIANFKREVVLDHNHLVVKDRGLVKVERDVWPEEEEQVAELANRLLATPLLDYYGQNPVSDAVRLVLTIVSDSETKSVEVVTDPTDQPPEELWEFLRKLSSLVRS